MIIMVLLPDVDTGSCPKFWFRIFHELRSHITHIFNAKDTRLSGLLEFGGFATPKNLPFGYY